MADTCVFCEIAAGRAPTSLIYEDEATLAFMDLAQPSRGHSLVIPKRHVQDIFGLDDALGAALFAATRRVAQASRLAFEPAAVTIWQQNGVPGRRCCTCTTTSCLAGGATASCGPGKT